MVLQRTVLLILVVAIGASCSSLLALAGDPASVSLTQRESAILSDVANGRFEKTPLLVAALVASGVEHEQEIARHSHAFQKLCQELERQPLDGSTSRDASFAEIAARRIHRFLHQHVLTGQYVADCHELPRTFDSGDYNCLTATILFHCLAERFELPVSAWATSTHVFCRLECDSTLHIELTSDHTAEAVYDESSPTAVARAAAVGSLAAAQRLSPASIIAKVYYNRAVAALERRDFVAAVAGFQKALRFDPADNTAAQNLLAAINNWALAECEAKRFAPAADLLTWGRHTAPDYHAFAVNDLHVHQQWILHLCQADRFAEALEVLEQGFDRRPAAPLFADGRVSVWMAWAKSVARRENATAANEIVERALRVFPDHPQLENLRQTLTGHGS